MTECNNCGQPFENDQSFDGSDKYCTIACSDEQIHKFINDEYEYIEEAKEIKADTKFYVIETDKSLSSEQKQVLRNDFREMVNTDLPILIFDRGYKLTLIDEEKNTRI